MQRNHIAVCLWFSAGYEANADGVRLCILGATSLTPILCESDGDGDGDGDAVFRS